MFLLELSQKCSEWDGVSRSEYLKWIGRIILSINWKIWWWRNTIIIIIKKNIKNINMNQSIND